MARRFHPPGVSFFAFQDIITAVAGIFILITLVMVLDLIDKVDASSNSSAGDAAAIQRIIDQMDHESEQIEKELNQRSHQFGRVSEAIVAAGTMDANQMRERIESRRKIAEDLSGQVTAAQRQWDRARGRLDERKRCDTAEKLAATMQSEALIQQAALIQRQLNDLSSSGSPLYNDTLADGRDLVIVRLGDHPGNADRLSIRDGGSHQRRTFVNIESLVASIRNVDHQERHYFILVAPGGASDLEILRKHLDDAAPPARYGYDVVGSQDEVTMYFELEL